MHLRCGSCKCRCKCRGDVRLKLVGFNRYHFNERRRIRSHSQSGTKRRSKMVRATLPGMA